MEITIKTQKLNSKLALKACSDFKQGDYAEAMIALIEILDAEPNNWPARLYLGVCYFKTGQSLGAIRAFRFVYDNCTNSELKRKACLALQAATSEVESGSDKNALPARSEAGMRINRPQSLDELFGDP